MLMDVRTVNERSAYPQHVVTNCTEEFFAKPIARFGGGLLVASTFPVLGFSRLTDLEGLLEAAGVGIVPPMLGHGVELSLIDILGGIPNSPTGRSR